MVEVGVQLQHSEARRWMKVSGQFHGPAALSPTPQRMASVHCKLLLIVL